MTNSCYFVGVLGALFAIYLYERTRHLDNFVSQRAQAVYSASRELFGKPGAAVTYTAYRSGVSGADPVMYTDIKRLWDEGRLSPEAVQKAL